MGHGRQSVQKRVRHLRCVVLVEELLQVLDLDRISDTMTIFHRGTMRKATQRQIFKFIANDKKFNRGRFFTTKLCRMVVKRLALKLQSDICIFPMTASWLEEQTRRLLKLCRKAKKLPADKPRVPSKKPKVVKMDHEETIPYEPESVLDSASHGYNIALEMPSQTYPDPKPLGVSGSSPREQPRAGGGVS